VAVQKRTRTRAPNHTPELKKLPRGVLATLTVAEHASDWLATRSNRTRRGDEQRLRDHWLPVLGSRRLTELRSGDVSAALREIQAKKGISLKSVQNAYAVLHDLLGDALRRGLLEEDPRLLPKDIWPAPAGSQNPPTFTDAEVAALTLDARLDAEQRVWNSIAFHTGLRDHELAQLRFRDWRSQIEPQLQPALADTLEEWQARGFEAVYGRAPVAEDWLVPRRSDVAMPHTAGSAYKAFRRCCVKLGIKPRSPNAIRYTFAARTAVTGAGADDAGADDAGAGGAPRQPVES
jgi:integrase